jgi:hypothetical protein
LGSIRVIHGWKPGATGKAPSAAVAVDNPSGLSPAAGRGTNGLTVLGIFASGKTTVNIKMTRMSYPTLFLILRRHRK